MEILSLQSQGARYVSMVPDETAHAHGDPRHPDGFTFILHDLCHLEKFVVESDYPGQVGFFLALSRALESPEFRRLESTFDETWRADRDYVAADMNGSAIFLFAALKMKLRMAVRRKYARLSGHPNPGQGPLSDVEQAHFAEELETLLDAFELGGTLRDDARAISARRDAPMSAERLLGHFSAMGARRLEATANA
jgi:hypothetical protein